MTRDVGRRIVHYSWELPMSERPETLGGVVCNVHFSWTVPILWTALCCSRVTLNVLALVKVAPSKSSAGLYITTSSFSLAHVLLE